MKIKYLLILLFLPIISCQEEDDSITEEIINEMSEDVVVVNSSTNDSLIELSDEFIIFNSNNSQISNLVAGDVLVSDVHPNAQNGYLRKILSVEEVDGNYKVNTSQAQLVDAIINTDFQTTYIINNEDVIEVDESGEDIPNRNSSNSLNSTISFEINDKVIYDADGNLNTTNDQITIDGNVALGFDVDFKIKVENRQVKSFGLTQNLSSTVEATIGFDVEIVDVTEQFILKRFRLSPVTIFIGPVPVVFTQWIVVLVGVDGSISLGLSYTATNEFETTYGIEYSREEGWNPVFNISNEFTYDDGSAFNFTGEIEPHIQARYEVRPYGLTNARVSVYIKPSIKLKGEIDTSNPSHTIITSDWCFDAGARAQMNIFDNTVLNFESSLFDETPCYPLFINIEPAKSPTPINEASDVPLDGLLAFIPGDDTPIDARFKLYFDSNQNPSTEFLLDVGVSQYQYSNLTENTAYYWRVETIDFDNEVLATSPIWSFETLSNTGGGMFDGNVVLLTQQEVDDFTSNDYSSINGYLFIGEQNNSNNISDISGFSSLNSINGDVNGNGLRINNSQLNSLEGFDNLQSIDGGISLANADNLNDISQLANITNIRNIQIFNCDNLTSLFGLHNIQTANNVSIVNNSNLLSLDLTNLSSTTNLEISSNEILPQLSGLSNLNNVNNLSIIQNSLLGDFCDLNNLIDNSGISGTYSVFSNQYNPTLQDLIDGNCSD
ncbi:hypothetical protein EAX61_00550 [Dokdonia sinensis]|uniref:Receptor L-domain domain-containing protein n=1 Tax=Dokdonia sinensis TaxID=2479847 RepID=A0A3M0GI05_9FLAO|nr:hypothetical protein [Dokdonia sinensis]RMB63908.1 hypothetical protein EAX61_00550 [Dokdonia sinensis]